jgi:protein KIBRA
MYPCNGVDFREQWRTRQEEMLRIYLQSAQNDLRAKQELIDVKQQRLSLAQDEYNHLNNALANLSVSTTSCEYLNYLIFYLV